MAQGPDRNRPRRFKALSLSRLAPNVATLMGMCAGLTSIRFAMQDHWEAAVTAILIAGIIDGLDGRLARMLNASSRFGAELDSLSDFVCFGVAPALLMYFWSLHQLGPIGWALCLLFAVCMSLRLARFNTQMLGEPEMPTWAYRFFTGVPAPAAAALSMWPMVLSFQFGVGIFDSPFITAPYIVLIAVLMVSRMPTFSFKKVKVPRAWVLPLMLAFGASVAFLVSSPWLTLSVIAGVYFVTFFFSFRSYRRMGVEQQRRSDELEEEEDLGQTDDDPEDGLNRVHQN
ncbi:MULTISPECIES: CDP-diacylglycerol--serine O-phosphatidyltransferase [unclassified Thalassospira]|jgi:CDP-diacylglycerol--serine O-phosphatidyltransferase|uniref:CDP-diacylglycerol--serine O-phosphatidyltransferase n=1 Tax=unclassified Thalassospira TaxID=2648997 RepID=UPI000A1DC098|nr:CDP-diacylglycerol--serine O-phosphatidyltransferase [Thalassospira sp. MCCC 1A01428]OSQ35609.1 CDP-diacylglycerol O-phosphatidyltransferase [Thalassospira sp. MCCC 1A01428]